MFTAEKSALLSALETARGAIERRITIPILANILFDRGEDEKHLRLRATDLDIEITVLFPAAVDETFTAFTVPALTLHSIVKSINGTEITVTPAPKQQHGMADIIVKSGRSRFRLPVLPASDFPALPTISTEPFEIGAQPFRQALSEIAFAISTEETRYYLNGVFVHRRKDDIALVATDGHRLAVRVINSGTAPAELPPAIIPAKTVGLLISNLPETGEVSLAISDSRIAVAYGNVLISSKLIDGTYPDYARIIPTALPNSVLADRRQLADSVKRTGLVSSRKTHPVKLTFANDLLTVELHDNDSGEALEEIDTECGFEEVIGINHTYLGEALERISGSKVSIGMDDAPQNVALKSRDGHDDDVIIIMLMRV